MWHQATKIDASYGWLIENEELHVHARAHDKHLPKLILRKWCGSQNILINSDTGVARLQSMEANLKWKTSQAAPLKHERVQQPILTKWSFIQWSWTSGTDAPSRVLIFYKPSGLCSPWALWSLESRPLVNHICWMHITLISNSWWIKS